MSRAVAGALPGSKETLDVWRNGKQVEVSVSVGSNGDDLQTASVTKEPGTPSAQQGLRTPAIGMDLMDVTPAVRHAMHLTAHQHGAVVVSINPDKGTEASGIQPGDIIVAVNSAPARTGRQVTQAISQAGKSGKKSVLLLVQRGGAQIFVAVPFADG